MPVSSDRSDYSLYNTSLTYAFNKVCYEE